jgi:hypothetical protein
MAAGEIREQVKEFKEKYAHGDDIEDCFAPWYLTEVYGISATEAIRCSAESKQGFNGPGYDYGIDAFHLAREDGKPPTLVVVQAKYSDGVKYVAQGIRDLKKGLPWLKCALRSSEAEFSPENKILVNLRADLANLTPEERPKVKLEFVVIHLNEEDDAIVNNRTREAQEDFKDACRDALPDAVFKIRLEGPRSIEHAPPPDIQPSPPRTIRFQGTSLQVDGNLETQMFLGIGRLSELVDMYVARKEDLFSKNARLFITSPKNVEKGPSARIKETLKTICADKTQSLAPEIFALYHNGVTMHARDVSLSPGSLSFRDPYVLNGCQTLITAYRFRYGSKSASSIDTALWERVTIPVRVINSRDDNLIRTVTINNNRQNAMTAAALRANDPVQIDLEHRLAEIEVFYERQEGAFQFMEDTDPNKLQRTYPNSQWGPVNIEDLARCLAAAAGNISVAKNTTDLFESDPAYNRCFSQIRTSSAHFLVFLQNVHNVLSPVLKNDLDLDWSTSYVKTGRVLYYVFCLLCRYLVKHQQLDVIEEYGTSIVGKDRSLRDEIAKQLDNYHSGIKGQIKDRFMTLQDTKTENLNAAFQKIEKSLSLRDNVDVFDSLRNCDDRWNDEG